MSDVSIKDVAYLAGVSTATVSRCLNRPDKVSADARRRVEAAIASTGYRPNALAQRFRRGRSNLVMVVLPSIGDPFFRRVMRGIRDAARQSGYAILIDETAGNTITVDDIGARVASRQADGIILLATPSPFGTEVVSSTSQRSLPIVIGCETMSPELDRFASVRIDNAAAAADAVRCLLDLGHRRIGMIRGVASSPLTQDRERGYRAAMAAAGLDVPAERLAEGHMTIDGARHATRRLLAADPAPTAIFCANDEMAIGCLHEVKAAGCRVPGDVSIVGFDDMPYAAVTDPPLTTIRQPAEEIGSRVMRRLATEIERGRPGPADTEIVAHELVVRASTGPPR